MQDTVIFAMQLRESISQPGREIVDIGRSIALSGGEPGGGVTLREGHRSLTLCIERSLLASLVPNLGTSFVTALTEDNAAHRLLAQYLGVLRNNTNIGPPALAQSIATHIADLVAMSLAGQRDNTAEVRRNVREARLRSIKARVLAWLGRHDLSTDLIAAQQHISPRYVRKLFESEGTSFSAFVLRERLARAHRNLSDANFRMRTIGSIAYECGFNDLSYFNQSFRRAFGATPSAVRRQAQGTTAISSSESQRRKVG